MRYRIVRRPEAIAPAADPTESRHSRADARRFQREALQASTAEKQIPRVRSG
jgi:hypothetical protein